MLKKIIIGTLVLIVVIGGWFILSQQSQNNKTSNTSNGTGVLKLVSENNFNFGEILMTGGFVRHNFTLKNTGDGPITITSAESSCSCTSANIINAKGDKVGPFGMVMSGVRNSNPRINMKILPGEEVTVEAIYNPLKHGINATGEIVREIFVKTDNGSEVSMQFRGDGVKEFSKVEGPSLRFNNKEHDFGTIKQSQGVVETKFPVINNGTETVVIKSLPASCACTTASIDKKSIAPGESAMITVKFDANLHQEPSGRFFKTIEVVSNIKPTPKLKIYADVNYDLGIDKLKLQNHEEIDGHTEKIDGHNGTGFTSISSNELSTELKNKNFILIDVHTPEQKHIPGTDYMIAYNDINKIISAIPNKNSKVILYCRSGSMSKRVAKELVTKGYTNVIDLSNGLNGWISENKPTVPKGSIKRI